MFLKTFLTPPELQFLRIKHNINNYKSYCLKGQTVFLRFYSLQFYYFGPLLLLSSTLFFWVPQAAKTAAHPVYTTCSAPSGKQTQLDSSWWT